MKRIFQSLLVLLAVGGIGLITYRAFLSKAKESSEQSQFSQVVQNTSVVPTSSGDNPPIVHSTVFALPLYAVGEGSGSIGSVIKLLDRLVGKDDPQNGR